MAEAYIIDAVRTPVGKRGGGLSTVHPADLGAHVIKAVLGDHVDPAAIDDHRRRLFVGEAPAK